MNFDSKEKANSIPPDSNTGVLPTIKLDYLAFTLPYTYENMDYLWDFFDNMGWDELGYGGMGYQKSIALGDGGRIFYHPERQKMGIHVRLGAKGLSQVLTTPVGLLKRVVEREGKFTRIDIAFDDLDGLLDIDEIYEKLLLGDVVTRWRRVARIEGHVMGDGGKTGYTINVGSRVSESFLRIYDKLLEQMAKKQDVSGIDHWVRVELELKGEKADVFGRIIVDTSAFEDGRTAGELCAELLLGMVDFKDKNEGEKNKSRWQTSTWWEEFVRTTSKLKLSIPKDKRTLQDSKNWLEKFVSSTMSMIVLSMDDDEGQSGFEFIMFCIAKGHHTMTKEQWTKLELFNRQQEAKKPPI